MTATEARYYRASRGCHRAWAATQPQLVIEGVLDEADAGTGCQSASVSSSAALLPHDHPPRSGSRSTYPTEER